jgi:type II secretory pathway component PulJ
MLKGLLRRARRLVRTDDGVTLMELVVAMTLSTALGALTLFLFISVSNSSDATNDRTINTASARNTLEAWSGYLQVSDGTSAGNGTNRFEYLAPNDMLFYADLNNRNNTTGTTAPTMMWLRIDSKGNLVEEQFASTAVSGSSWSTCRVIAIQATAGITDLPQLFTAKSASGNTFSSGSLGSAPTSGVGCQVLPQTPPSAQGQLSSVVSTNLQTVRTVEIAFTIVDSQGKHPLEFDSVVTLPVLGATT